MACTFREDLNFLANDSFRFINNATITVIVIATFNGIEVKSPVIIPTPKNNATNNNKGIMSKHCSFYVLPSFLPAFQLKYLFLTNDEERGFHVLYLLIFKPLRLLELAHSRCCRGFIGQSLHLSR